MDADVRRYFDAAVTGSVVVIAAGLLDPASPEAEHERVNISLVVQVINGACSAGLRVVTLGTVMERLAYDVNRYVAAKPGWPRPWSKEHPKAAVSAHVSRSDVGVHLRGGLGVKCQEVVS